MFSALRTGSPIYILHKGEHPSLKIGSVVSVSAPQPNYAATSCMEQEVDVVAMVDDEQVTLEKLPAQQGVSRSKSTPTMVVSDDRMAMINEVEAMLDQSKRALEAVPYHEDVVEQCGAMLQRLNPRLAKEAAQEQKITRLENQVSEMMETLNKMMGLMEGAASERRGA